MASVKKCKSCKLEIDPKATKCPHCQSDQRNWFIRHPIITILLVISGFFAIGSSGGGSGNSNSNKVSNSVSKSENTKVVKGTLPPEPSETPPKEIEPITFNGTGQQATTKFQLQPGLSVFSMKNTGGSNFSIWLLNDEGDKIELLVNEIGSFDGSKAVKIKNQGNYLLDIASSGKWNINIKQPRTNTAPETTSFKGTTQTTTDLFYAQKGLKAVKMNHSGSSNFAVWLMNKEGDPIELLVNEIGNFDGSKAVRIPVDNLYLFNVAADGNWSISLE